MDNVYFRLDISEPDPKDLAAWRVGGFVFSTDLPKWLGCAGGDRWACLEFLDERLAGMNVSAEHIRASF